MVFAGKLISKVDVEDTVFDLPCPHAKEPRRMRKRDLRSLFPEALWKPDGPATGLKEFVEWVSGFGLVPSRNTFGLVVPGPKTQMFTINNRNIFPMSDFAGRD